MLSFEKTSLWRGSFGNSKFSADQDAIQVLRGCLLNVRDRAEHLVSLIPRDIPGLTVHDVTHLDALWETASLIAGEDYPLNPAEAFVFGGAVLLHDSAMSLAAYPGGVDEVKKTAEWKDAVASRLVSTTGGSISRAQLDAPPEHIASAALGDVLRGTHANRASELPSVKWPTPDGGQEHLIQDSDLRETYGDIIGKIAASHWWTVPELRELPPRVNAGGKVPAAWYVNPLKIACLLRVADAAHIDHRRAPRFLRALLRLDQSSDIHWAFQTKLGKPSIDKNFLVYTGSPFDVREAEAWWLGYDMLAAIDDELRAVHGALDNQRVQPFAATAVKGAKSPQAIAEHIPTKRWKPINTELRVSDVPSLVEKLGGQHLYGADLSAPVREIIQNAADAIQARRLISDLSSNSGRIKVKLCRTETGDFLDFQDDGIGMSSRVLTGALLDFGRSFWRTRAMRQEFPGLLSKGLKTTGRFGVGFFAVFMLGDHVTVTSRRYDAAVLDTQTLDFQKGLRMRPVLREPTQDELLSEYGTRVRVALRIRYDEPGGLLFRGQNGAAKHSVSLRDLVARVSPAVSVTIETEEQGQKEIAIAADDWLTQEPDKLVERTSGEFPEWRWVEIKSMLPNLRVLQDTATMEIHGRACVNTGSVSYVHAGVVTVGGFRASEMQAISGVLKGEPETVARNSAMPTVTGPVLRDWATEQAMLIAASTASGEHKLRAAAIIMLCGGDASCLPVAIYDGEHLTQEGLEQLLRKLHEIEVYEGIDIDYDEEDNVRPKDFKNNFIVSPTLLFVPEKTSPILQVGAEVFRFNRNDTFAGVS